jgi:Matrixin
MKIRLLAMIFAAWCCNASAYVTYPDPDDPTQYLKWGADNHAGTPGGTIYWSFIPAGTSGSAYCGNACPGTSGDSINIQIAPAAGFTLTKITTLEPQITAMMAEWSAVTGIRFVKLDSDSGVPINDPSAAPPTTGQIRIGVFAFSSDVSEAGAGFAPPPNGGTGAGDILFNSNDYYQFAPGNEGDSFDTTYAPNDIESLILHEFGHAAVGLNHPPNNGTCPVMCVESECLGIIKRQLTADDIAGAQFLYGEIFFNGFD